MLRSKLLKFRIHIIVDGLSSDSTLKLVENSKFVNKVISEKDNSLYDAINKGIEISSGDLIKNFKF